jgi:predicted nucleotidyltransferase
MPNRNLELLTDAAELLRPLLNDLVFVGGCATALLITDQAAAEVRPTFDVDAIADITSYADYVLFSERLRTLGFSEDASEGAPLCRWLKAQTTLDVMPLDEKILGFSNRWYKPAMEFSERQTLKSGLSIRVVTAPYFCATKLEAFEGRGRDDYWSSHDLEDLIAVIDGRQELVDELSGASEDVRSYIASEFRRLLEVDVFIDALPGYLLPDAVSQARIGLLLERLKAIATL